MVSVKELEESSNFIPQFDKQGLVPVITTDTKDGSVLMQAYANQEAIEKSLKTGLAHYYSRSRKRIWQKGEQSGLVQKIQRILIDCDQDCLIFEVEQIGGAACHTGRKSCFYRKIDLDNFHKSGEIKLQKINDQKIFDPGKVYK